MEVSKFQFKGYKILRSFIEMTENVNEEGISLSFDAAGILKSQQNVFILNLKLKIKSRDGNLKIEIDAKGTFEFEPVEDVNNIGQFFYMNSTAILFPYLRAYIATLTNLSSVKTINLPTMNLTNLAKELKQNTVIE